MAQQQQPPEPLTELKLVEPIVKAVNESYTSGKPCIFAYVDANGQPSLSFRGSAQAYSDTALSIWARNPEGGLLKSLPNNPRVTIMYRDPETRASLQFRGVARIDNSEETRDHVYNNMPEPERNADKEKKGSPIIIDLERVDGFMPGIRVAMRK